MNLRFLREQWTIIVVYLILGLLVLLSSVVSEVFLRPRNIENILRAAVALGLVSIGQTFAILIGGIDLSMGSLVSLTSCLTTGLILGRSILVVPVVALVLALVLFIGFCNGFIITRTGISPLIVTIGMMAVVEGAVLMYTKSPIGEIPSFFGFIAWGRVGFIPNPVLILGVTTAVGIIVLRRTRFGCYIYATGGNPETAKLSGINTDRIKIYTYMISSFTAGLAGLFLASQMGMGDPVIGERFMLDSLVPVLIGGTSLTGGKGSLWGTIGGVFILTVLSNTLNLFEVSPYWQWIIEGGIVIIAVAFYLKERT